MQLGNTTIPDTLRDGRYTVGKLLGQGGMAMVATAHDNELGVDRAVKVVYATGRNRSSLRRRLKSEARAMAKLHHPNILSIHDVGAEGELDYVIMDLASGGSLQDRLTEEGPLRPAIAVQYIIQVLSALAAAHAAGVVHRDVKPHNILLDGAGRALLADFGIAMLVGEDRGTKSGVAMGSLAFMPPEQRLDAAKVGPEADVYACGSTLFNLLTGENPVDLFLANKDSARWTNVPEPLRPVLRKACKMRPDDRWTTAGDMAYALLEVLRADAEGFHTVEGPLEPVFPAPSQSLSHHTTPSRHGTLAPEEPASATAHAVEALEKIAPPPATHEHTRTSDEDVPDGPTDGTWAATLAYDDKPVPPAAPRSPFVVIGAVLVGLLLCLGGASTAFLNAQPPAGPVATVPRPIEPPPTIEPAGPEPAVEPAPTEPVPAELVPSAPAPKPAVAVTPAAPRPLEPPVVSSSKVAGGWQGTMGGALVDLKLQGSDDRLRGTMSTTIATKVSTQPVGGSFDPATNRLVLAESGAAPARFELELVGGKLNGSVTKATGGRGPLILGRR